ncbi:malic oxidoreductase [Artemisia annua]|uniref:Malic oxidoreductase n=1 Tax=Artemisia annua TaxID=35608 RepID=A0A2U1NUJ5_ARTAN|nr:malic oxidoreductase [Artemisia annua]
MGVGGMMFLVTKGNKSHHCTASHVIVVESVLPRTDEEIQKCKFYPSIGSIRSITTEVGAVVLRVAVTKEK